MNAYIYATWPWPPKDYELMAFISGRGRFLPPGMRTCADLMLKSICFSMNDELPSAHWATNGQYNSDATKTDRIPYFFDILISIVWFKRFRWAHTGIWHSQSSHARAYTQCVALASLHEKTSPKHVQRTAKVSSHYYISFFFAAVHAVLLFLEHGSLSVGNFCWLIFCCNQNRHIWHIARSQQANGLKILKSQKTH